MLVLTRKNRESVVIGRPEDLEIALEITILEIEGGRVRLGFQADTKMPIHRREVWDRICNGHGNGNGNGEVVARS
jgi:carbon storage regulator CsrA